MVTGKASRLPKPPPEYLSAHAAARLAGLPESRRVARNVQADAWELGPNGKKWQLYTRETIERWIADGMPTAIQGGAE